MVGLNQAGTANPDDYNLGRGKVYFATLDSNNFPEAYRDLGNATEFNVSIDTEKLDHQSSREGLKVIDKEVVISQKMNLSLTLDEINFENLALFFSGSSGTRTNNGGTAITGSNNLTVTTQGRWYDLYEGAAGIPSTDPQGSRIYDIGTVSIEKTGGGSVMTEGTDFTVDQTMGRIFVIDGGDMVAGGYDLDTTTNTDAITDLEQVKALTASAVEGALKFISENPADSDKQAEFQFHKVKLSAEGDFGLISDDWSTMQLSGTAEQNLDADPDSPYCTVNTFENAGVV